MRVSSCSDNGKSREKRTQSAPWKRNERQRKEKKKLRAYLRMVCVEPLVDRFVLLFESMVLRVLLPLFLLPQPLQPPAYLCLLRPIRPDYFGLLGIEAGLD